MKSRPCRAAVGPPDGRGPGLRGVAQQGLLAAPLPAPRHRRPLAPPQDPLAGRIQEGDHRADQAAPLVQEELQGQR